MCLQNRRYIGQEVARPKMVEHLFLCSEDYKTNMDYKNIDFNSDVVVVVKAEPPKPKQ